MSASAIELNKVEKQLGAFHLGPLNLAIPTGAVYGLIGPNGAGKTTTLDLLMGIGQPDSGDIQILGLDLRRDEVEIKSRTAYVSPDLNYQAWGTVRRALDFVSGFYPDWNHTRCARLQAEFSLYNDEKIATLSFGSRIKLSLIMALSREADLLLLDEPTVGLDAVSRRQLFKELLAFMQHEDRTIVVSSHQLADLERFADHITIMNRGKLLTSGRIDDLLERFVLVHVNNLSATYAPDPGIRVIKRDGDDAQLLVDLQLVAREQLYANGLTIIGELPLTLEDLFLHLVAHRA